MTDRRFECCYFARTPLEFEIPGVKKCMAAAVDRLLERYPDAKVVEDVSSVLDVTHWRFPNDAIEKGLAFALVRTIELDRDVDYD